MKRITQIQIFLVVLTFGFLTGPRALQALAKITNAQDSLAQTRETEKNPGLLENSRAKDAALADKNGGTFAESQDPYAALALDAKSVYVWDINTHQKLYGKNEEKQFPLASVAKMMMALVAVELLSSETKVTIDTLDMSQEGDNGLYLGEKWSFADLLKFTLIASSNDGASAIASVAGASLAGGDASGVFTNKRLFIEKMNEKARTIGLAHTHFLNESGLDVDSITSGAYGSSRDMTMLFEYIFKKHPELFTSTTFKKIDIASENNIVHHVANTNEGVAKVTGLIGSKTGYTDLAGGNLVVVVDVGINHPVVIAVLGSTRDGRFTDVEQLIDATVKEITSP